MNIQEFSLKYLDLLQTEFKGLNLTNILDEQEFYNKQIFDSLYPIQHSSLLEQELKKIGLIVDVGFGGGFPLIPLAFAYPEIKFVGVEATQKKMKAVQKIAEHFQLKNVRFLHSRIEDLDLDRPALVTFKAVGPIKRTLDLLNVKAEIMCAFYKGPGLDEMEGKELDEVYKTWIKLEDRSYQLPSEELRRFLILKPNVPCGTSQSLDFKGKINSNRSKESRIKSGNTRIKLSDILSH